MKEKTINSTRIWYEWARAFFVFSAFIFFLNYFIVGKSFYEDITWAILPFSYILFLSSFSLFIIFSIRYFLKDKLNKPTLIPIAYTIWAVVFLISLIPLFKWFIS